LNNLNLKDKFAKQQKSFREKNQISPYFCFLQGRT